MSTSLASTVLMIRPCNFGFNSETAATNIFQKNLSFSQIEIQNRALTEFDNFVKILRGNNIRAEIFDDEPTPVTPDSIFPNNWFSTQEDLLILYPMLTPNRRNEKRKDIIEFLKKKYTIKKTIDLSHYENENKFLEGTGSMVFDHKHRIGYGTISSRTNNALAEEVCQLLSYKAIIFSAADINGNEIYHTNVMMSIGDGFAIACLDSIKNSSEKKSVRTSLEKSGLGIVEISFEQMNAFCGNALELQNSDGEKFLVMSENAYKAFHKNQISALEKYAKIIYSSLDTIEAVGGGSARCMMAEIYELMKLRIR